MAETINHFSRMKLAYGHDSCKKEPYVLEKYQYLPKLLIGQATHQFYGYRFKPGQWVGREF